MISLNTLNQINDIMTILNNTAKKSQKAQPKNSFAQTMQQVTVQTPAQTVQQMTIKPSMLQSRFMNDLCCVCEKAPAVTWVNGKPYCKECKPDSRVDTEEK